MARDILEPDAIYCPARVHAVVVVDGVLLAFAAHQADEPRPSDATQADAWITGADADDAPAMAIAVRPRGPTPTAADGEGAIGWRSSPMHPVVRSIVAAARQSSPQPQQARRGAANGAAALTERQVQQVRDLAAMGFAQRAIAAHFGLSQSTVSDIVSGRAWSHLPDAPRSALRPVTPADADALPSIPTRRTR